MIRQIIFGRDTEEVAIDTTKGSIKRPMGPQYAVMRLLNDLTPAGGST
jgi:hypothetical protein